MTPNDLAAIQRKLPLSAACLKRNSSSSASPSPKPEPPVCDEPVAETPRAAHNVLPRVVSICSFRTRLLDPDNPCVKYFVDALRHIGLIADDTCKDITLSVRQEKVAKRSEERTEIIIT